MRRFTAALFGALLGSCVAAGLASAAAVGEGLLPHKAVYSLRLGEQRSSSAVLEAAGRFEFEWQDVCDGWTVGQKFRIVLVYEDGASVTFGWSLSSWESKDGRHYRFFIRRFDDHGQTEAVRGEARLEEDGSGTALFLDPEEREVPLPAGTLFPTGHTLHVLAKVAEEGAPIWTLVFDGSGEKGLFGVSAALSRRFAPDAPRQLESALLDGIASWRVNLAFYGTDAADLEPEQEQVLRLFANGVVDEMSLDYRDFVIDADLTELTALPPPDC